MANKILGLSGDLLEVDSGSNSLRSSIYDSTGFELAKGNRENITDAHKGLLISGKHNSISVPIRTDLIGNQISGNINLELIDQFENVSNQKWTSTNGTFSPTTSSILGFNANSTNSTTSGAYAILLSNNFFNNYPRQPLNVRTRLRHNLVANSYCDFGFGTPTTTTLLVPTGVQVRMVTSGSVQIVFTFNGAEIASANVISKINGNGNTIGNDLDMSNSYYTNSFFVYDLYLKNTSVLLSIYDTSTGTCIGDVELNVPKDILSQWSISAAPFYFRVVNSSTPSTAPVFTVSEVSIGSLDTNIIRDISQMAAQLDFSAGRSPFTGIATENHTNSTAPTSATLSNTAAGYTTLGGRFQFATVAGAATDYALFAFQVPTNSKFICEGVSIESYNTGAAVATTGTVLEWALGFNSTGVSLATANIVRRQVGVQTFADRDAIGKKAERIDLDFITGERVGSGRYIHVILNMPIGTATASQIIRGQVLIKGRFI